MDEASALDNLMIALAKAGLLEYRDFAQLRDLMYQAMQAESDTLDWDVLITMQDQRIALEIQQLRAIVRSSEDSAHRIHSLETVDISRYRDIAKNQQVAREGEGQAASDQDLF